MADHEPAEPDLFSFRPLDEVDGSTLKEMGDEMRERGATWLRVTIVSPEYPKPPYHHGLYMEGWLKRPAQEAEFSYPPANVEQADTVNQK